MTTAAVILAAGAGTRFGGEPGAKLRAEVRGRPLVRWAVDVARSARHAGVVEDVVVVVGADDLLDVLPDDVTVLVNEDWAAGIATSLAGAVRLADALGHEAVVVALADQPGLTVEAWGAVASATARPAARATYLGKPGHPVRLHHSLWSRLPLEGDRGAGALLAGRPDLVELVPCQGDPADIDTRGDLQRWS